MGPQYSRYVKKHSFYCHHSQAGLIIIYPFPFSAEVFFPAVFLVLIYQSLFFTAYNRNDSIKFKQKLFI